MSDRIKSALERLRPSLFPTAAARVAFASQMRLTETQWLPRESLEQYQLGHLKTLARFAASQTPFWGARIAPDQIEDAPSLGAALARLPILSRAQLRDENESLRATRLPQGHHAAGEQSSSGSTGMVVRVAVTNVVARWQNILGLRSHLWAGRDFAQSIAVIRRQPPGFALPQGKAARWADRGSIPFPTGPAFLLDPNVSLEQQWEWLGRIKPAYLMASPSIIRNFAQRTSGDVPSLKGLSTTGEIVDDELRSLVRARFGLPIHDMYSSQEAGCMAIQCPDEVSYHVPSEAIIVEVVDDDGRPCALGEIGRVLVTPLFNFATPLLRYDLGDFAEAGGDCPCGRGLPVLRRIMGRRRNILVTSDGRHFWPSIQARGLQEIVRVNAHQFRQVAPDVIEIWLAMDGTATPGQEERMRGIFAATLPVPFEIRFRYVSEFPRHPGGKHEEFISLVAASP